MWTLPSHYCSKLIQDGLEELNVQGKNNQIYRGKQETTS